MHNQRGVTLIELMVVLVILAILVVSSIFSFSGIVSSARDAKRKADINFLQKLLAAYYLDHGFFPTAETAGVSPLNCQLTLHPVSPECVSLLSELKVYSPKIPFDPSDRYLTGENNCQNGRCYEYITPDPAHTVSCICAGLENATSDNKPPSCGNTQYNYCLQISF